MKHGLELPVIGDPDRAVDEDAQGEEGPVLESLWVRHRCQDEFVPMLFCAWEDWRLGRLVRRSRERRPSSSLPG